MPWRADRSTMILSSLSARIPWRRPVAWLAGAGAFGVAAALAAWLGAGLPAIVPLAIAAVLTLAGAAWQEASRRAADPVPEVPAGSVLGVLADGSTSHLLAFDPLGCGEGGRVRVATGSVAAAWFPGKAPPIDALIIGIIDESARAGKKKSK